jgi:NADH/F420H2 dehydrogenase subunit C
MDIRTPVSTIYGDSVVRFSEIWKSQIATLQNRFVGVIEEVRMPTESATEVPVIYVKRESIVGVLNFLKTESGFEYGFLADLTATDELPEDGSVCEYRFEMVYNLFSHSSKARIRIKVRLRENESIATAIPVWPGANWAEREVFDMFGIQFQGHPDLRRLLMDERWVGHPLRKDYPLRGYQVFSEPEPMNTGLLE